MKLRKPTFLQLLKYCVVLVWNKDPIIIFKTCRYIIISCGSSIEEISAHRRILLEDAF